MADKKTAKKPVEKKPAAKAGRPPKLAEVTEMDLGPKLTPFVHRAAESLGVHPGVVVRALARKAGNELRSTGNIGMRMALKRYL